MKEALSFDDVLLVPQYSNIKSRTEVDISNKLDDKNNFTLPVISSPMDTITGETMATSMASHGALGIVHRYNSIEEQILTLSNIEGTRAAAIGMTGDYLERAARPGRPSRR